MAKNNKDDNPAGLFVPAGILTGMGIGFLTGDLVGWMFTGLGVGFLVFALVSSFLARK